MSVPKNHPRYVSLTTRDRLVEGWENGLVATQGLIAHGRGEAFDYLLGEKTTVEGELAERIAACRLGLAERPVISVNGNVGALVPQGVAELSRLLGCPVEVNIFHRTGERVRKLVEHLKEHGCENVLGLEPDARLEGLDHARALCCKDGIYDADVVLVPLEDGDRCQSLRASGKDVITIDLNPLSRTSQTATITIVDNLIRAVPNLITKTKQIMVGLSKMEYSLEQLQKEIDGFDNGTNLVRVLGNMVEGFAEGRDK